MAQAESAQGWERPARAVDLVVWLWRMLASAQFAVAVLAFLAVAGLLAVLLPQVPGALRDNPVAVELWLAERRGDFGVFTDPLYRIGLFTVVASWWFLTGLALLALSVVVYTADRFVVTWQNVAHPRERLPDSFFARAANRAALSVPGDAPARRLAALLRRRRFAVRASAAGETSYVFADRFAWGQLGTFLTHGAVVLLLVGGFVSRLGGFTSDLLIAEGATSPVFAVSHPGQMLVEAEDAVARFDASGSPVDYRTELVIYQGGEEVARGPSTVNDPLSYGGYRFHQAAYIGDGAALRVRDAATGVTQFRESFPLEDRTAAPRVVVRDAGGSLLLDDVIVPTDFIQGASGTLVSVPGSNRLFWVGLTEDSAGTARGLVVYEPEDPASGLVVDEGASGTAGGLTWTYQGTAGLPFVLAPGVPGDSDQAMLLLAQTPAGEPYLTALGPVDGRALTLYADQPVRVGEREYVFEGRREFAGIQVRRDPGVNFIWAGAGLLIAGLLVTFYVPRLRLWARVRGEEVVLASTAERSGVFRSEAERLRQALDAEPEVDDGGTADG